MVSVDKFKDRFTLKSDAAEAKHKTHIKHQHKPPTQFMRRNPTITYLLHQIQENLPAAPPVGSAASFKGSWADADWQLTTRRCERDVRRCVPSSQWERLQGCGTVRGTLFNAAAGNSWKTYGLVLKPHNGFFAKFCYLIFLFSMIYLYISSYPCCIIYIIFGVPTLGFCL